MLCFVSSLLFSSAQRRIKPVREAGLHASRTPTGAAAFPGVLLAVRQLALIPRCGVQACDTRGSLCSPKQLEKPALVLQSCHWNCQKAERHRKKIISLSQPFCFLVLIGKMNKEECVIPQSRSPSPISQTLNSHPSSVYFPNLTLRLKRAGREGDAIARKYWELTGNQSISLADCWWDNGFPSWTSRHLGWEDISLLVPLKPKDSKGWGDPDCSQPELAKTWGCVCSAWKASCILCAHHNPDRQRARLLDFPLGPLLDSIRIFTPTGSQWFKF